MAEPMNLLRTPDSRFSDLPDFAHEPRYVTLNGVRIHYIEDGTGSVVLLLHGVPAWCFVYRKLFPPLRAKHRIVAPDFMGFGRSDKADSPAAHTLARHRDLLTAFVHALDLRGITLVVHDWGGLIGLAALHALEDRVDRLVVMNTGLPIGDTPPPAEFLKWRDYVQRTPDLPIGKIVRSGLAHPEAMTRDVLGAYDAPFPDDTYKAGIRALPLLVPLQPGDAVATEMQRTRDFLATWAKPTLVMFSDRDPVTRGGGKFFCEHIPAAWPEIVIGDAGHFLQEEKASEVAAQIANFIAASAPS
jgi:haloalkane dehalogenase